ncbi:MAG: hypothetical protein AVDCRST_MAG85-796, partial [uncultured Solirubrobacteraceae bacterium]
AGGPRPQGGRADDRRRDRCADRRGRRPRADAVPPRGRRTRPRARLLALRGARRVPPMAAGDRADVGCACACRRSATSGV